MKRTEYAMRIKEISMNVIYQIMDEIKNNISPEGILWEAVDDLEGEYIRWVDEMTIQELIDRRHEIHDIDYLGMMIKTEILGRLL